MVNVIQSLVSTLKFLIKCPYSMKPIGITIHNTENDATAKNEIEYMKSNLKKCSFHFAVDDKEIVQAIPLNRNAWHAGDGGNGTGNRKTIGIEICYSKSGGDKFIKAEKNAAELTAKLLKDNNWSIKDVYRHKDWSGKDCPKLTMKLGWDRFLKMVQAELDELNKVKVITPSVVTSAKSKEDSSVLSLQKALNKAYGAKLKEDGVRGDKTNTEIKKHLVKNFTKNEYAKWIQTRLKALGYNIDVDGKYGSDSTSVVKKFQKAKGLTVDGVVGYKTCCKLL